MRDSPHLTDLEIQSLLDGALDGPQAEEARLHLAACGSCAGRVEAQARLFAAIESWGEAAPPHDLAPRVVRSIADGRTPLGLRLATAAEAGLAALLVALAWPLLTAPLASLTLPTIAGLRTVVPDALAGLADAAVVLEALLRQASGALEPWGPMAREWMALGPAIVAGALIVAILGNSILLAGDSAGRRGNRPRRV